ncbi:uncharacterized protein LOC119082326 [Bradysia coprophila]|uniref:uncharacterized protein LOC119082326 n=1 Tax=Bradysia coprophila TaxID=38358 RepID=UPI00187DBDA2|nr:uncharacterized protein LOC119082326 [Bradysia coprophila]
MKFWILNCVIGLVYLFVFCDASKHKFGQHVEYGMYQSYQRTLINDINKAPKNYTIIYQYFGAKNKEVAYLEFDINVKSEGSVSSSYGKKIEAKIHINNALNVTANIYIYTMGLSVMPQFNFYREHYDTKSITFVHKKNADSSKKQLFAQNAIGRRRKGDSLLHFESRNITNSSRFPSRAFEYTGSDFITYVGFSFNSPTAMAMINTSYVGEQEFNAVAYDMNTEHFIANMSVYGIKERALQRPFQFEGVI